VAAEDTVRWGTNPVSARGAIRGTAAHLQPNVCRRTGTFVAVTALGICMYAVMALLAKVALCDDGPRTVGHTRAAAGGID